MKRLSYRFAMVSMILSFLGILFLFYISIIPINLVEVKKVSALKTTYKRGENLEKVIEICKKTDVPITVNLELSNGDIILIATKQSFGPKGCREYVVAQSIPQETALGRHTLIVTVTHPYAFRTIKTSFESDKFYVTR